MASIITNTILGVPCYNLEFNIPQDPIQIVKAPFVRLYVSGSSGFGVQKPAVLTYSWDASGKASVPSGAYKLLSLVSSQSCAGHEVKELM